MMTARLILVLSFLTLIGLLCLVLDIQDLFYSEIALTKGSSTVKREVGRIDVDGGSVVETKKEEIVPKMVENQVGKIETVDVDVEEEDPWDVPVLDLQTALRRNLTLIPLELGHSGFGSQVNNLVARLVYYGDSGPTMVVRTQRYYMQYNKTVGVLAGWFRPTFPLVQNKQDKNMLPPQLKKKMHRCKFPTSGDFRFKAYPEKFHDLMPQNSHNNTLDYDFFARHATAACQNFRFNQNAKKTFHQLLQAKGIPEFKQINANGGKTVTFHVRRGDKVDTRHSRLIQGEEYVDKLLQVISNQDKLELKHCFVATDDYKGVIEVRDALIKQNINCTIHTLTKEQEHGHQEKDALKGVYQKDTWDEFFTETHMMIEATYFVGAMNSNVARFAMLLRYCAHPHVPNFHQAPDYHRSYDVEGHTWYPL